MLPDGADWSSVATQALEAAVDYLRDRLGDDVDSWRWGSIHGTAPRHPLSDSFPDLAELLDPPSTPMSGDGDTPHSASFNAGDPFTVTGTSVARYVFDAADWDNSRWVVPLGASGHPGSRHVRRPEYGLGGRRRGADAVHVGGHRGGGGAKADTEASARGLGYRSRPWTFGAVLSRAHYSPSRGRSGRSTTWSKGCHALDVANGHTGVGKG